MNIDEIMQQIGQNIKRYRKSLNLTQKQLAEKMTTNTNSTSISQYENGKRNNITLLTLIDFAQALEVKLMDLIAFLKAESEVRKYPEPLYRIIENDGLGLCPDEVRVLKQVTGDKKTENDYLLILTVLRIVNGGNYKVVIDELIGKARSKG